MSKILEIRKLIAREVKAALKEAYDEEFEDSFALDQSAGGVDHSLDRVVGDLQKLQIEMNKLFALYKEGKLSKEDYIAKRKPLQTKRDQLEKQLY